MTVALFWQPYSGALNATTICQQAKVANLPRCSDSVSGVVIIQRDRNILHLWWITLIEYVKLSEGIGTKWIAQRMIASKFPTQNNHYNRPVILRPVINTMIIILELQSQTFYLITIVPSERSKERLNVLILLCTIINPMPSNINPTIGQ